MKHNDWTEQLRQRLNDAEVPAPENLWDSISQQLGTQGRQQNTQGQQQDAEDAQVAQKPHRVALLPWAAAASVVLIAGVGMWWQLRSNTPDIAMLEPASHPITLTDNKAVNTKASAANSHISTTSSNAMLAYKDNALVPTHYTNAGSAHCLPSATHPASGQQHTLASGCRHSGQHEPLQVVRPHLC